MNLMDSYDEVSDRIYVIGCIIEQSDPITRQDLLTIKRNLEIISEFGCPYIARGVCHDFLSKSNLREVFYRNHIDIKQFL